jgi:hypothetical protein
MGEIMRQPTSFMAHDRKGPTSLNRDYRKKELMKITQENLHILHRIQRAQPMYSHVEWSQHQKAMRQYLSNCCEYPVLIDAGGSSREGNV